MEIVVPARKPYPSDVSNEGRTFVALSVTLMDEVFNSLCSIVRGGLHWRLMPHDLPSSPAVYQPTRRGPAVGVFATLVHDLHALGHRRI